MRTSRLVKILLAGFLSLAMFSFGLGNTPLVHAAADHSRTSSQNCSEGCQANILHHAKIADEQRQEKPDKKSVPVEPFYAQFAVVAAPKKLPATGMPQGGLSRPPDLVMLYANFRI
ncbi:MAG TPA: hypothetical protein VFT87_03005 [Candidatus Saccharimonadales bacterium]|nr:hypothetical protein [Candidatus Saccharimonadales bacterium]